MAQSNNDSFTFISNSTQQLRDLSVADLNSFQPSVPQVLRQSVDFTGDAGALTLSTAQSGSVILLDEDNTCTVTLPQVLASDIGAQFTFIESVASNNARSVTTFVHNDKFVGGVQIGTTVVEAGAFGFVAAGADDDVITLDDDLVNGAGAVGSVFTVTAVLTGNTSSTDDAAGNTDALVWAITGSLGTSDDNCNGDAVFTASA